MYVYNSIIIGRLQWENWPCTWGQPRLHSECQASHGYVARPCFKQNQDKTQQNNKKDNTYKRRFFFHTTAHFLSPLFLSGEGFSSLWTLKKSATELGKFALLSPSFSVSIGHATMLGNTLVCSEPLKSSYSSSLFFLWLSQLLSVPPCLIASCDRLVDHESPNSHTEILTTKVMVLGGGAFGGNFYLFEKILEGSSIPFAVWHCRNMGTYGLSLHS